MEEREALRALEQASERLVDGVVEALPSWAEREVRRLLDAWARHAPVDRDGIAAAARRAGEAAAQRVGAELRLLFGLDPGDQRVTPLQVVRSAHVEVAPVLEAAGLPHVERDDFAERALPDDHYGLAPDTLADLGGEELNDAHLAWGAAKAAVHLARRPPGGSG